LYTIVNGNSQLLSMVQTDTAIWNTFFSMVEGQEYRVANYWVNESDAIASEYSEPPLDPDSLCFTRKGSKLLANKKEVFDFNVDDNLAMRLAYHLGSHDDYSASSFAVVTAFMYGAIEKLAASPRTEIIEIGGKRYKLSPI